MSGATSVDAPHSGRKPAGVAGGSKQKAVDSRQRAAGSTKHEVGGNPHWAFLLGSRGVVLELRGLYTRNLSKNRLGTNQLYPL